jgi:two-component system chemotaxis response regulator CheB
VIRVAIADDSPFTCNLLASYIQEAGDCEVVGVAHDASATIDLVRETTPDVLTLDLQMPGGNGFDLLRQISSGPPVAVVVISGVTRLAAAATLQALELGAVDFVLKYTPGAPVSRASLKREIVSKIKMAAAAQPAARTVPAVLPTVAIPETAARTALRPTPRPPTAPNGYRVLVIGASTGGPKAVGELMAQLPADYNAACLIVQHLPASFTAPFAAQLGRLSRIPVREAVSGDRLEPGCALVTPGAFHVAIGPHGVIELKPPSGQDMYCPSIDAAMISAAEHCGPAAVGVVLSGMGNDGAEGLRRIRAAGGEAYVQDLASCVMASMPERALELAGADHVARPDRIAQMLVARSKW